MSIIIYGYDAMRFNADNYESPNGSYLYNIQSNSPWPDDNDNTTPVAGNFQDWSLIKLQGGGNLGNLVQNTSSPGDNPLYDASYTHYYNERFVLFSDISGVEVGHFQPPGANSPLENPAYNPQNPFGTTPPAAGQLINLKLFDDDYGNEVYIALIRGDAITYNDGATPTPTIYTVGYKFSFAKEPSGKIHGRTGLEESGLFASSGLLSPALYNGTSTYGGLDYLFLASGQGVTVPFDKSFSSINFAGALDPSSNERGLYTYTPTWETVPVDPNGTIITPDPNTNAHNAIQFGNSASSVTWPTSFNNAMGIPVFAFPDDYISSNISNVNQGDPVLGPEGLLPYLLGSSSIRCGSTIYLNLSDWPMYTGIRIGLICTGAIVHNTSISALGGDPWTYLKLIKYIAAPSIASPPVVDYYEYSGTGAVSSPSSYTRIGDSDSDNGGWDIVQYYFEYVPLSTIYVDGHSPWQNSSSNVAGLRENLYWYAKHILGTNGYVYYDERDNQTDGTTTNIGYTGSGITGRVRRAYTEKNVPFSRDAFFTNTSGVTYYRFRPAYANKPPSGNTPPTTVNYIRLMDKNDDDNPTKGTNSPEDYVVIPSSSFASNQLPAAPGSSGGSVTPGDIIYLEVFNSTVNALTGSDNQVVLQRIDDFTPAHTNNFGNLSNVLVFQYVSSSNNPVCLTDTCDVLTPNGYVNIKDLSVGDLVTTPEGKNVKITKVMKPTTHHAMGKAYPHFIPKNSLGENKPSKHTFISKNHAYKLGEEWKCGMNIVEHNTTNWDKPFVTYYNIMTEDYPNHSLVVNGVEMEPWGGYELGKPQVLNNKLRNEKITNKFNLPWSRSIRWRTAAMM